MDVEEKLVEIIKFYADFLSRDTIDSIVDNIIAEYEHGQQWISVKDGKPENDHGKHWKERRHYLVRLQNGTMVVARYGYKDYGWWIDSHDCVLDKERYREVTHWMPLPQPPKGE